MKKYREFLLYNYSKNNNYSSLAEKVKELTKHNNLHEDILILDTDNEVLEEGSRKIARINVYERNHKAREVCLNYYGYSCQICDFNFEETYGIIGRKFIHVHHIVHLSQISKTYMIDPLKDMVPVCPNCHAMLHSKKENGEFPTILELKRILNHGI